MLVLSGGADGLCSYQDADLILLALATHEPSFRILREDPREKHDIRCIICQSYGHAYKNCLGEQLQICILLRRRTSADASVFNQQLYLMIGRCPQSEIMRSSLHPA